MSSSSSNFKLNEEHWHALIQYMENHRDFACGRVSGISGRDTHRKLWSDLVKLLNSLGHGTRSVEKWQKCWADYKSNLKKKAAQIKQSQGKTGGGPGLEDKLNQLELRVLNIMGRSSYEGCGTKELGFENNFLNASTSSAQNENVDEGNSVVLFTTETQPNTRPNTNEKKESAKRNISKICDDHDYLPMRSAAGTKKKKTSKSLEDMHEECLTVLKNIENSLHTGLTDINDTLNHKISVLSDILLQTPNNQ